LNTPSTALYSVLVQYGTVLLCSVLLQYSAHVQ